MIMRLIHARGGDGWEALVFTSEACDRDDFFGKVESGREGFEIAFDGRIVLPETFLPGDGDLFEKEPLG